ncbi:diadenylate cyclase [Thermodesulfobacteriota bacterium]
MTEEFIHTIRLQDIFDILLMSYILFRLYVLFKGTNVFRVLVGMLILWFLQKISFYVGLIVTGWALQGFTALAAIIIIVIFRNEIRSVLQAKNFKAIFWEPPRKETDTPVDIIADSMLEMASNGTGSIIVIPGKEDIDDSVHSGIKWNGLVSKEMITSIFFHDNPVHDGAVVISGDRVAQVGAVLPLSHKKSLPSYYGMRHRAAVGLSEVTDALVILSSEERRDVIVTKSGSARRAVNKNELTHMINEHLGIIDEDLRNYKREKLELVMIAVISFLFVTVIWLSFTRGADTLMTLDVPVEYTSSNKEMKVLDAPVKRVSLDLNGSGTLLKNLVPGQLKVSIDLSDGDIGRNIYYITEENVALPPGVFLRNTNPSSIDIALDKIIGKKVPVQVNWSGKLSEDVLISEVIISPEDAIISGPSLLLKDITTVYTEKVPLEDIEKSGIINVNLDLNNSAIKINDGSNGKFELTVKVASREILD